MKIEIIVEPFKPNNLRLLVENQEINLTTREVVELRDGLTKWLNNPIMNAMRDD